MESSKLDIEIESSTNNFIIEEKDISKMYLVFPFIRDEVSATLIEKKQNDFFLHIYDEMACSCVGSHIHMSRFYSPNLLTKTVKIIIPKNFIHNLKVNLENGNLVLKNLHLQNANIFCVRGNIRVVDSNIVTTNMVGWESDISISHLEGESCFALTKTGNLKLKKISPDVTTLKTNTGNIKVFSDYDGVNYTFFDIESKFIRNSVHPMKEVQKTIRCVAPYGHVDINVL